MKKTTLFTALICFNIHAGLQSSKELITPFDASTPSPSLFAFIEPVADDNFQQTCCICQESKNPILFLDYCTTCKNKICCLCDMNMCEKNDLTLDKKSDLFFVTTTCFQCNSIFKILGLPSRSLQDCRQIIMLDRATCEKYNTIEIE